MKVVCAWCKKIMGEKDTHDDLLVSHTICRECSIKYWGVDPEEVKERMSKNPAVDPRPPKRKKGTTGWKFYSSSRNKRDAQFEAMHARRSGWLPMLKLNKYSDLYEVWVTTKGNPGAKWHDEQSLYHARMSSLSSEPIIKSDHAGQSYAHEYSATESRKLAMNPAVSERQRKFMCAELGRLRAGKRTRTGMKEKSFRDFCRKLKRKRKHKNPYVPMWKSGLINEAKRQAESGAGYTKYEIIDYLKNQHKDIPEKSIVSAVNIALKVKRRKRKNPVTSSKRSMWKRVIKETAEYLRKAGYDKDSAYVSIFNRLRGVPDELIRSSVNEAYRMGKNNH